MVCAGGKNDLAQSAVLALMLVYPQPRGFTQQAIKSGRFGFGFLTQSLDRTPYQPSHRRAFLPGLAVEPGFILGVKTDNRAYHFGRFDIKVYRRYHDVNDAEKITGPAARGQGDRMTTADGSITP
jgi:hypothetical protein